MIFDTWHVSLIFVSNQIYANDHIMAGLSLGEKLRPNPVNIIQQNKNKIYDHKSWRAAIGYSIACVHVPLKRSHSFLVRPVIHLSTLLC